jgi:hypothetical protein
MDRLKGVVLGGGHLLEGGGVDDDIDAVEGLVQAFGVADVAEEVAHAAMGLDGKALGHLELLELVAREDDQPPRLVALEDELHHPLSKRAGAAGDQDALGVQHGDS